MSRRRPTTATLASMAVVALAAYVCLSKVPPGSVGLLIRGGDVVALLAPGVHAHLPWSRVITVPAGRTELSGSVTIQTQEGASLDLSYRVSLDISTASHTALGGVAMDLASGVDLPAAVANQVRLAASQFGAGATSAVPAISDKLASVGIIPGTLILGASAAGAAPAPNPLKGAWSPPPWGVLVIGIDSADWDLITPLIESGSLPNLARLRDTGAWGTLRSMKPTLSPLLWTTIATGRAPEDHGVIDFLMKDPATGADLPISRHFRRVKALWNITSDLGFPSATVGWWATWPAESVVGAMVTDRVAYSLFDLPAAREPAGLAFPEELASEIDRLRVNPESIRLEELREIIDVPAKVYEHARESLESPEGYRDPVGHVIRILSSTLTYHNIALSLLRTRPGGLTMIYYEGLDEMNHRFAQYLAPALGLTRGTDPALKAAFSEAIPNFYRLQDRLVGDLLNAAPPATVVVVLSDHGFANGRERPIDVPPDVEGQPGLWHTLDGILIAVGPPIHPGRLGSNAELLDVTPTLLALLGLPKAGDMPGRVIPGLFTANGGPRIAELAVASYDAMGPPLMQEPVSSVPAQDAEMIAKLTALGYVQSAPGTAPGSDTTTSVYHINAGNIFLSKNELERAREEFAIARKLAPRFDQPLLGLAQVELLSGRPAQALPHLEEALALVPEPQPTLLTRAAQVYLKAGQQRRGLAFLEKLNLAGRPEAFRLAALGMLHEGSGDARAALTCYRQALEIDGSVERALYGAYTLMKRDGDLEELSKLLTASLDVESVTVAVRAANWLALTRELQGRRPEARKVLTEALAKSPDDVMTLTNLGSMLVRDDKAADGLPFLERAYRSHPRSLEVLVDLIVANGRVGRLEEARRFFAEGEKLARRPELYNAIAYACFLNGQKGEARTYLERSLAMDPGQDEAHRLLRLLDRAGV